ncbi:MAG: radical SAM protein [bacterium]
MSEQPTPSERPYAGFEQGPIRPPSEAESLLIRVTRNCPWNRCTFCPVYKDHEFSRRPVEHVIRDLDAVWFYTKNLRERLDAGNDPESDLEDVLRFTAQAHDLLDLPAFQAACHWLSHGEQRSVFLQDANSLAGKPADLLFILRHLKQRFPEVKRVTSYARSATITRIAGENLLAMCEAGLNRIHVGLESGADEVLQRVQKGVTKAKHIEAGTLIKAAGMELSEYYMPGLGGREFSRQHALESADALNEIDPHFIRLRSLAIPGGTPLHEQWIAGEFEPCNDIELVEETGQFLDRLDGITSRIRSDHILNLFQDLEGTYPADKGRLLGIGQRFLALPGAEQRLYRVGRRLGLFLGLDDLDDPHRRALAEAGLRQLGVTATNCDQVLSDLMRRFV